MPATDIRLLGFSWPVDNAAHYATLISSGISATSARPDCQSNQVIYLPQVGQDTTSMPPLRPASSVGPDLADDLLSRRRPLGYRMLLDSWFGISPRPMKT